MSIDMPLESASLAQLQDTPIDRVLNIIEENLVHLPTYQELYYRWERQQWSAQEIDFTEDRKQWLAMPAEEQRMRLFGFSSFFKGEECVTNTLAPYIIAMPDDDMRIYATTQLVDEARHTVFFERFFREVLDIDQGKLEDTLAVVSQNMNERIHYILVDLLNDVSDRIRREPTHMPHLVEGVTLYHLVIEGALALSGQRNMLELYREQNIFPGYRSGFTAVARDESRHVIFGVKFLRDMIQRDNANATIVHDAVQKYAPLAITAVTPIDEQIQQILAEGRDPWLSPRYAVESLRKKLKVVGLSMELPTVPPPPA